MLLNCALNIVRHRINHLILKSIRYKISMKAQTLVCQLFDRLQLVAGDEKLIKCSTRIQAGIPFKLRWAFHCFSIEKAVIQDFMHIIARLLTN